MIKETKKVNVNWHGGTKELNLEVLKLPDEKGKKFKYFMDVDICLYADCVDDHDTYEDRAQAAITSGLLILCTKAEYFEYTKYGPAGGNEEFVIYSNDITDLLLIQGYLMDICGFGSEHADDTPASIYINGNYVE